MTKLLPCPFCGGTATMEQTTENRWSVGCDSADEPTCMGYQSFTTFSRQCEATSAWNKRAPKLDHDTLVAIVMDKSSINMTMEACERQAHRIADAILGGSR